jgi:hypothetical protein
LSGCRSLAARYLFALAMNAALLGPLAAPPRAPTPPPIVATATRRLDGERVRRWRGGVEEVWLVGRAFRAEHVPSPN